MQHSAYQWGMPSVGTIPDAYQSQPQYDNSHTATTRLGLQLQTLLCVPQATVTATASQALRIIISSSFPGGPEIIN